VPAWAGGVLSVGQRELPCSVLELARSCSASVTYKSWSGSVSACHAAQAAATEEATEHDLGMDHIYDSRSEYQTHVEWLWCATAARPPRALQPRRRQPAVPSHALSCTFTKTVFLCYWMRTMVWLPGGMLRSAGLKR